MADSPANAQTMPARPQSRMGLQFVYANLGPLILEQLGMETSFTSAFSPNVAVHIDMYHTGYRTEQVLESVTPMMNEFLDKVYPVAERKTRNHRIAHWVCNQYLTHRHNGKPILAEDLYKVGEALTYFDSLKNSKAFKDSGANPDLLSYKTLAAFQEMLQPFQQQKALREADEAERKMKPEVRAQLKAETTILYSGPEGKVVIPHTPFASQYWGSNTKWCIAGEKYADKHFPVYNAKSPVIMLLPAGQSDNKVALVDKTLYDNADKTISELPPVHDALLQTCLNTLAPHTRRGLERCIPSAVNTSDKQEQDSWSRMLDDELSKIHKKEKLNPALWNDRTFVLEAAQRWRSAIEYASPDLQKDRTFLLDAIEKNYSIIEDIAPVFQNDRSFKQEAIQKNCLVLFQLENSDRYDQVFIKECLEQSADLAFNIQAGRRHVYQPDDRTLMTCQIKALERIVQKGDIQKFHDHIRHFKSTWGDADRLFGDPAATLDKIKAEFQAQHSPTPSKAPGMK